MSIRVSCSECGKTYRLDESAAGKRAKCKNCGAAFTVAAAEEAHLPAAGASDEYDPFAALSELQQIAALQPEPALPISLPARRVSYAPVGSAIKPAAISRRLGRRPAASGSIGVDSITPLLIIFYILVQLGLAIYASVNAPSRRFGETIWATSFLEIILFFAVLGPAIYLGVFIMSKIFGCNMVDLGYLRGCGVASLPKLILCLVYVLPANPVLLIVLFLSIIPVMILVLKFAFDLDLVGTVVAAVFGGALFAVAEIFTIAVLVAAVISSLGGSSKFKNLANSDGGSGSVSISNVRSDRISSRAFDPDAMRLDDLRRDLQQADDRSEYGREHLVQEYARLNEELAALRQSKGTDPAFAQVEQQLADFKQRADSSPSELPDKKIFESQAPAEVFSAGNWDGELGEEVSYKKYFLRPPKSALLDLSTREDDSQGLSWTMGTYRIKFTINSFPLENPLQRRVWAMTHSFQLPHARDRKIFGVDATHSAVTTGTINGLEFTRIVPDASGNSRYGDLRYIARVGTSWIVMEIGGHADDAMSAQIFEAAARTFRSALPGEHRKDLYAPQAMVARLQDDPTHATIILRQAGPAAEPALLDGLLL